MIDQFNYSQQYQIILAEWLARAQNRQRKPINANFETDHICKLPAGRLRVASLGASSSTSRAAPFL
jgi:hypothetical protein